jgi:tetratricopeptide (TPR) repeat protein
MSRLKQLIQELHRRSLWQVLGIYVVGGWLVLQAVDTLAGALNLPEWAPPLALFLLIIGLPIVLATAFVQEGVGRRARGGAAEGEVETTAGGTPIPLPAAAAEGTPRRLFTWRNAIVGGVIAFSLLFGLAGVFVLIRDRTAQESPEEALARDAPPAIAVLPADTRGGSSSAIGEGLDVLLAPWLDAVPGWRSVSPRTVRARWSEQVPDGATADLETSLEVARATGARYAVLPAAVPLGQRVQLSAEIFDVASGDRLGETLSTLGHPDSLTALTDSLGARIMSLILQGEGKIPEIETSQVTSASPAALKAFLEGEVLFREYRTADAVEAYRRAVSEDTAFALAHYRLAEAAQWASTGSSSRQWMQRASLSPDRLNDRERLVVKAAIARDTRETARLLRQAAQTYPDDATVWYWLGETLIHFPGPLATIDEVEHAFSRALELDPGRATLYNHPVMLAFRSRADSAHATDLVRRFVDVSAGVSGDYRSDVDPRAGDLAVALAFGDSSTRAAALERLQSPDDSLARALAWSTNGYLAHPDFADAFVASAIVIADSVNSSYAAIEESDTRTVRDVGIDNQFLGLALWSGKLREAGRLLDLWARGSTTPPALSMPAQLYVARAMGLPVPAAELEKLNEHFGPKSISADSEPGRLLYAAFLATDQSRWEDHARALAQLQQRIDSLSARADSLLRTPDGAGAAARGLGRARMLGYYRAVAEGYGAWRQGDGAAATALFLEALDSPDAFTHTNALPRFWLAELYIERSEWEEAARVLNSWAWDEFWTPFTAEPLVRRRLGHVYEQMGEVEKARQAYADFIAAWADADPEGQVLVEEAREALVRLGFPDQ